MTHSAKVRAIREHAKNLREHAENLNPAAAAERAAKQFERAAIAIPATLVAEQSDPQWRQRISSDAAHLYTAVVMAGETGVPLKDLRAGLGRERAALKLLRSSGAIVESRQCPPGSTRELIILRAISA